MFGVLLGIVDCDKIDKNGVKFFIFNNHNEIKFMNNISNFEQAIITVEKLPLEEQEMLVEIIKNRLHEQKRFELITEIKQAEKEYEEGNFKRGSVKDLMADLDS